MTNAFKEHIETGARVDARTTRDLLRTLAQMKQEELLLSLRSFLLNHGLYTFYTYSKELETLKALQRPDLAIALFNWRRENLPTKIVQQELLDIIGAHKRGAISLAFRSHTLFYKWCQEGLRDVLGKEGFHEQMDVWILRGPSALVDDKLRELIGYMTSGIDGRLFRLSPFGYRKLVDGFQNFNLVKKYFELAIRTGCASPKLYESYIKRLFVEKRSQWAIKLYHKMLASVEERKMITPQLLTLVFRHYTAARDFDGTRVLFENMESLGIQPTTEMYAMMIELCALVKDLEMAQRFLWTELPRHGLEPDQNIYGAMVKLYSAVGDLGRAESAIHEMRLRGGKDSPKTLEPLIIAYLERSRLDNDEVMENKAVALWNELASNGMTAPISLIAYACAWFSDEDLVAKIIKNVPRLVGSENDLNDLMKQIGRLEGVSFWRHAFMLRQLTLNPEFVIEPVIYERMIRFAASEKLWAQAFEVAFELTDLASSFHSTSNRRQVRLQYTSQAAFLRPRRHSFSFTDRSANTFIDSVVLPNELSSPPSLLIGDPSVAWNLSRLDQWKDELSRWKSEAKLSDLL